MRTMGSWHTISFCFPFFSLISTSIFSKKGWTKALPFDIMIHADHANVAQSVEQLIRNQQVRGSSPLIGSRHIEV